MKYFYVQFLLVFFVISAANAQQFTDINAGLPGFKNANLHWGDYDNDNDLDLLVVGRKMMDPTSNNTITASEIYRNDGGNVFTDIDAGIAGVYNGYATWGDFDNDNDLDVLVCGKIAVGNLTTVAHVFRNDGSDVFSFMVSLDSLENGYADWGDINNDGFLDILLTGDIYISPTNYNPKTILYQNDQQGGFFELATALTDISYGACDIADYDNDGDQDIFLSGVGSQEILSELFENTNGSFVNTSQNIVGFTKGACGWADYDNDGDFDLIVAGAEGGVSASATTLYKNEDNQYLPVVLQGADTLPPLSFPSVDWGDYDNDGDMDILLTGQIGILATRYTGIFRNDGGDVFTEVTEGLVPVRTGDARWGDYDGDGDLDIALCGTDTSNVFGEYVTRIYRNELQAAANNPPSPPQQFTAEIIDNQVNFTWTGGYDEETPESSLTYNIMIGSEPGSTNLASPMTSPENGFRIINHIGNAGMNHFYYLNNTNQQAYYWRVQTIDGAYEGSDFSEEQVFYPNSVRIDKNKTNIISNPNVYPNPASRVINIDFTASNKSTSIIYFRNYTGKIIYQAAIEIKQGNNSYKPDLELFSSGIYYFSMKTEDQIMQGKFIVIGKE